MSSSAKKKEEPQQASSLNITIADADVTEETGPVENVFLSEPYNRMILKGQSLYEHTFWNVVVFNLSEKDNEKTEAKVVESDGENVLRVIKPKYPSFMFGNKLTVFADLILEGETEAAKGMTQATMKHKKNNKVTIDVRFPLPIQTFVRTVSSTHCELCRSPYECSKCGMKDFFEMPNVIVYEVEAIRNIETAEGTTRHQKKSAHMSE